MQHVMALSDSDWKPCEWIQESTPEALKGCIKYLHEKSKERRNELRLSRQASFMTQSDCRDFRAYFPEFITFSVANALANLEQRSKTESTASVISRNAEHKKEHNLSARE